MKIWMKVETYLFLFLLLKWRKNYAFSQIKYILKLHR